MVKGDPSTVAGQQPSDVVEETITEVEKRGVGGGGGGAEFDTTLSFIIPEQSVPSNDDVLVIDHNINIKGVVDGQEVSLSDVPVRFSGSLNVPDDDPANAELLVDVYGDGAPINNKIEAEKPGNTVAVAQGRPATQSISTGDDIILKVGSTGDALVGVTGIVTAQFNTDEGVESEDDGGGGGTVTVS